MKKPTYSIYAIILWLAALSSLSCAWFIYRNGLLDGNSINTFESMLLQRETQTLVIIGLYFGQLALCGYVFNLLRRAIFHRPS